MTTETHAEAATTITVPREAIRQVRDLCSEFYSDVRQICPRGILSFGDPSDNEGADFGFSLEVKPSDYENIVKQTSVLERKYYFKYGVNFLISVRTI